MNSIWFDSRDRMPIIVPTNCAYGPVCTHGVGVHEDCCECNPPPPECGCFDCGSADLMSVQFCDLDPCYLLAISNGIEVDPEGGECRRIRFDVQTQDHPDGRCNPWSFFLAWPNGIQDGEPHRVTINWFDPDQNEWMLQNAEGGNDCDCFIFSDVPLFCCDQPVTLRVGCDCCECCDLRGRNCFRVRIENDALGEVYRQTFNPCEAVAPGDCCRPVFDLSYSFDGLCNGVDPPFLTFLEITCYCANSGSGSGLLADCGPYRFLHVSSGTPCTIDPGVISCVAAPGGNWSYEALYSQCSPVYSEFRFTMADAPPPIGDDRCAACGEWRVYLEQLNCETGEPLAAGPAISPSRAQTSRPRQPCREDAADRKRHAERKKNNQVKARRKQLVTAG